MTLNRLERGVIIRDEFQEIQNVKIKMAVLVGLEPRVKVCKFFMINSQITCKARSIPQIRDRQVPIDAYDFLNYLSYINCAQVISRPLTRLRQRFDEGKAKICGQLREADLIKVFAQAEKAVTLSPKDKKLIASPFSIEF